MKILIEGTYESEHDWYTIVVDKVKKQVFGIKNFSCRAAECESLKQVFNIPGIDVQHRFYFVSCGTTISDALIPKKYSKFEILQ